jgi:hypothetical protein
MTLYIFITRLYTCMVVRSPLHWTVFYEFLKCGLYNTYNTCIIRFVWYSEQMWAVFTAGGASRIKTYYTRIIRIIQPTFQETQFNKRSYNTRSCIIAHMAVYYTLYYTYGSILLYTWKVAVIIIRCIIRVYYTHVLYIRFNSPLSQSGFTFGFGIEQVLDG